jgi:hypothetical protein
MFAASTDDPLCLMYFVLYLCDASDVSVPCQYVNR